MSIEIVKGFPPPFLFSNTSTKDWKQCRRKFYLRYLYEGRGLTGVYVDAIRFLMSSGNITSGTFTLYGLASAA